MIYREEVLKNLPSGYTLEDDSIVSIKGRISCFGVICPENHLWANCTVYKLSVGKKCPVCVNAERGSDRLLSKQEFEEHLKNRGYGLVSDYFGMAKRVTIQCNTCGNIRSCTAYNIHDRCMVCSNKSRKESTDKEILRNLEINNVSVVSRDGNVYTLHCKKCNQEYSVVRKSLLRRTYCSICASNRTLTLDGIQTRIGEEYIVEGSYVNERSILKFTRKVCGHSFERSWNAFQRGLVCPDCSPTKKLTTEKLQGIFEKYRLSHISGEYKNVDSPLQLKCEIPHHPIFTKSIRQLQYAEMYYCPECVPKKRSSKEELIAQYIESLGIEVRRNDTSFGKEIDIYVPSRNMGIEYCGHVYHNHTRKLPSAHIDKQEFLKQKGIDVAFIFDDQWKTRDSLFSWVKRIIADEEVTYTSYHVLPYYTGLNFFNFNYCDQLAGTSQLLFFGGFVGTVLTGVLIFRADIFKATCVGQIGINELFLKYAISSLQSNGFKSINVISRCQYLEDIPFDNLGYVGVSTSIDECIVRGSYRKKYTLGDPIPYGWLRLTGCRVKEYFLV